jgi:hypothetical protein
MALVLTLNNIEITPLGALKLDQKISSIDTLGFSFAVFEGFKRINYEVILKDNNVQVFRGRINNQTIIQNDNQRIVECVAFGEIYKLENCLTHIEKTYIGSVVDLLNTNNQGIVFENYNLQSKDLFFNSQVQIKSYLQLLEEIRTKSSIQYYFNYQTNKCYLGVPTGTGFNTNDLIYCNEENDKVTNLPTVQSIDYSKIANRISISSGTQNSIGIEFATITEPQYPKLEQNDLAFSNETYTCIEDPASIFDYGLKEDFIRGINISTANGELSNKESISNYLYKVSVDKISVLSKPQIQLQDLSYQCQNSYELNLFNVFDLDYTLLGQEINDKYIIESISRDFTEIKDGIHKAQINLTNYIDRGFDRTRLYFDFLQAKATDQVSTTSQTIPISTSSNSFSYSIDSKFKTVEQYNLSLTFAGIGAFTISSIKIDSYDLTSYFSPLSFTTAGSTNSFDITSSSLPISVKSQLELSGNHTLTISTASNINTTGTITVSGYA